MAGLIRCDKCGCVRRPDATRPVVVYFCDERGVCDPYGKIHWQNKDIPKAIRQDLCANCWTKFVDKTHQYFNIK